MALIDEVKTVCDRLATHGWRDLLLSASGGQLDIAKPSTAALKAELEKKLTAIDRTVPGLQDFHKLGAKGITPGRPEQSLLFHALASPAVHPSGSEAPSPHGHHYATLEELDVLENYIYSLVADRTDLQDTVVAVFAYQYREASRSPHLRHADFAYSRTGVGRVGTAASQYDSSRRSFWVLPSDGSKAICALPARYGVFLARVGKRAKVGTVQGAGDGSDPDYLFPVHKLFPGRECIAGTELDVEFLEYHRNEKLRMLHRLPQSDGGLPLPDGFDLDKAPYVRDSTNGGSLVALKASGSTVLLVPHHHTQLARTVSQVNSVSNRREMVYFRVPRLGMLRGRQNRYQTSLEVPGFEGDRLAPEYVNIRHQVDPADTADQVPANLNLLDAATFTATLATGGYPAAHFADDTCDGVVEAVVSGLPGKKQSFAAFSLVTAPDFFPLADQIEVRNDPSDSKLTPLSEGRLPPNPKLPRPSHPAQAAFARTDVTVTAVVGHLAAGPAVPIRGTPNRAVSWLPDAASNVFAPGWDVSRSRDAVGAFMTSSGLGSPFPEDAKLCAALASFWPAVAPDNGRTFGNEKPFQSELPMLDAELGFHPQHERVKDGSVQSSRGWDGEFGPFYEEIQGRAHVNFVDIKRSDYVQHALLGHVEVQIRG